MEEPRPRGATFLIIASSRPGKYAETKNHVDIYPPDGDISCKLFGITWQFKFCVRRYGDRFRGTDGQ